MCLLAVMPGLPGTICFSTRLAHACAPGLWGTANWRYRRRYYRLTAHPGQLRLDKLDAWFRGQAPRAHMPDDPPPDHRGQIDARSEAAPMRLIGEDIRRQRQPTPRPHGPYVLLPTGTDHALESHGRDIPEHGAPCYAQSTVGGDQRLPGHVGAHAALAQDELGEDRAHRFAGGAWHPPEGEPPSRTRA